MTTQGEMLSSQSPTVPESVTRTVLDAAMRAGEVVVDEHGARTYHGSSTDPVEKPLWHTVEVPVGALGHDLGEMIARRAAQEADTGTVTLTIVDDPRKKARF